MLKNKSKFILLPVLCFIAVFSLLPVMDVLAAGPPPPPGTPGSTPPPPAGDPTDEDGGSIIPCVNKCSFFDIIQLVKNVINKIIVISIPIATLIIAFSGWKYMTTGIVDDKKKAKSMITNVFIGFAVMLAAWLIVNTVFRALINNSFPNNAIFLEERTNTNTN